jgi:hypothetical protein
VPRCKENEMIISEKQIMQLMELVRQLQTILLLASNNERAKHQYNCSDELLNSIANQQSEELKVIE